MSAHTVPAVAARAVCDPCSYSGPLRATKHDAQKDVKRHNEQNHPKPKGKEQLPPVKWVSCGREYWEIGSMDRHLINLKGTGETTYCGATGLPGYRTRGSVWRGNSTKPKCEHCLKAAERFGYKIEDLPA